MPKLMPLLVCYIGPTTEEMDEKDGLPLIHKGQVGQLIWRHGGASLVYFFGRPYEDLYLVLNEDLTSY